MKSRTIIVEDEPLARERLHDLLVADPDIDLCAECGDGRSAVEKVHELEPDLLFLDIQMPELDGFGVLAELSLEKLPAVVFVTAYDQFALKAFEVHAVDYLLKPFDRERFRAALQRAKDRIGSQQSPPAEQGLRALIADLRPEAKSLQKIAIKSTGRVTFVKIEDIDWVEAADNYVNIHAGTAAHLLRETMTALSTRLPSEKFVHQPLLHREPRPGEGTPAALSRRILRLPQRRNEAHHEPQLPQQPAAPDGWRRVGIEKWSPAPPRAANHQFFTQRLRSALSAAGSVALLMTPPVDQRSKVGLKPLPGVLAAFGSFLNSSRYFCSATAAAVE